ncbi:MAG: type II toxin-antitoxin system RelE/ParE family toxin [Ktedonobacteraceae bacterium]
MKLIVSPEAREDLREIEEYIAQDNPQAAVDFVGRLTDRFAELVEFPGSGRRRDDIRIGYRSVSVKDYLIFYRVSGEAVEVMHVLHGRRDLPKLFEKE